MRALTYDQLPLLPYVIAECVSERPYAGEECSTQNRPDPSPVEAMRQRMTQNDRTEFARLCDARCRAAFAVKAEWFIKCAKSRGERGRDQLYLWISHWLSSFLRDPIAFRRSCGARFIDAPPCVSQYPKRILLRGRYV